MTPESLSREGSPGPEGIHLHPAPGLGPHHHHHQVSVANKGNGPGVIMSNDNPAQVVASHLEVKTNNFPPGVSHPVITGAQSEYFIANFIDQKKFREIAYNHCIFTNFEQKCSSIII